MVAVLKSSSESLLEWVKVNNWLMETECRRYRCRKYVSGEDVMSDPGEVRYQLYGPNGMRLGAPAQSFGLARARAEEDVAKHSTAGEKP